ncbi:MAG: DUF3325 family protein [Pseudomonadota bacterium]
MDLLTITALLYVSSTAFFHASKKRTTFAKLKASAALRRTLSALAWIGVVAAFVLIVSRKGFEVGIPLWIGAWVVAAVLSVFLHAVWQRAHLPTAALCTATFVAGVFAVPWGTSS